jgi:hypothetical protein
MSNIDRDLEWKCMMQELREYTFISYQLYIADRIKGSGYECGELLSIDEFLRDPEMKGFRDLGLNVYQKTGDKLEVLTMTDSGERFPNVKIDFPKFEVPENGGLK